MDAVDSSDVDINPYGLSPRAVPRNQTRIHNQTTEWTLWHLQWPLLTTATDDRDANLGKSLDNDGLGFHAPWYPIVDNPHDGHVTAAWASESKNSPSKAQNRSLGRRQKGTCLLAVQTGHYSTTSGDNTTLQTASERPTAFIFQIVQPKRHAMGKARPGQGIARLNGPLRPWIMSIGLTTQQPFTMDRSTADFTSQGSAYDGFNSRPRSGTYHNDERLVTSINDTNEKLITSDDDDDDDDGLVIVKVQAVPKAPIVVDVRNSTYGGPLALKPGCDVELEDHSFLRITETITSSPSMRYIRGHRLLLQNHYELLMPERHHELVQLVKVDNDLNVEVALWTIPVDLAIRNCKIIYTNQQYKQLNYRKDVQGSGCDEDEKPIYFCRYTSADTNVGVDERNPTSPPLAGRIEHLRFHQAESGRLITKDGQDIQFQIPDAEARRQWRGDANCTLGGSHTEYRYGHEKQKYTFGDAFAGAGGTSWGAHTAGLKMKFAFDFDPWAIKTYKYNFGITGMQILQMNVHDFVRKAVLEDRGLTKTCLVDFLHLSPPCQPFCGANRRPNIAENAMNLSAFARVADLLEICKPRIATLEESKSLTDVDKRNYFKSLIGFFIKKGYSVQWKALDLERWGVPQTRRRLIVIASGPGEKLPTFLKPTHGDEPGLMPLPAIGPTIRSIPCNAPHHDEIPRMMEEKRGYDENKLSPTILTRPKANHYHPSGTRRFSIREHAALQTFPHTFVFCGPRVQKAKQVGNAVPPEFATKMFDHYSSKLREADMAEMSEAAKALEAGE
ncbi:hypothetical protein PV04_03095 [Phialophora macrospora]|uniref:DNA (cytosine-5-)-methyltransferase n=1 Tax=Phialophora macrospora TaxID=1851006 RepID=A0A0D2FR80_9EURO|nr:hypothetical protein PV04_03095 [Phialophora macrospora]